MLSMLRNSKMGSARRQIGIKTVEDGVIEFADHKHRMILETSSVNFELMSQQEQDTVIETYRQFLNSLSFPVQILVRVREVSVENYLKKVEAKAHNEPSEVYKNQLISYVEFIEKFMEQNKIMARRFFFVVAPSEETKSKTLLKEQLSLNADIISKGLARMGIVTKKLDSLDALDLFYSFYSDSYSPKLMLTHETLEQLQGASL